MPIQSDRRLFFLITIRKSLSLSSTDSGLIWLALFPSRCRFAARPLSNIQMCERWLLSGQERLLALSYLCGCHSFGQSVQRRTSLQSQKERMWLGNECKCLFSLLSQATFLLRLHQVNCTKKSLEDTLPDTHPTHVLYPPGEMPTPRPSRITEFVSA